MTNRSDILCFRRATLPPDWLPGEGAIPLSWETLCTMLEGEHPADWLPRAEVEEDPRWKQPIPYVLVEDRAGRLATYRRSGGERRVHGHWSVGIGGHVERIDGRSGLGDTLLACARREVVEELGQMPEALRFLGIVNAEITAVGRVHWGLVFEARLPIAVDHSPELGPVHWHDPDHIRRSAASSDATGIELELWSHLALGLLNRSGKLAIDDPHRIPAAYSIPNTENEP